MCVRVCHNWPKLTKWPKRTKLAKNGLNWLKMAKKWQKNCHICQILSKLANFSAWVTWPERPKGAKDKVRGPKGSPPRSWGPEGLYTSSILIFCKIKNTPVAPFHRPLYKRGFQPLKFEFISFCSRI